MDVLIASGQPNLRFSLEVFLRQQPGIVVIGSVSTTESLLALVRAAQPELIVLDWNLPGRSLVEILSEVKAIAQRPYIIVLSKAATVAKTVIDAGADEFLLQGDDPPAALLEAIHRARSNQT